MSKGSESFSAEYRLYLVFVLALLVIFGFYYFRSTQTSPSITGGRADSLHKYAWKDASGNVYLALDSTNTLPSAESVAPQPDLIAVPANITFPTPVPNGFSREVFQVERQRKAEAAITESAMIQDFLVGETHFGKSQLEVARTLCRLLRDFEIASVVASKPANGGQGKTGQRGCPRT